MPGLSAHFKAAEELYKLMTGKDLIWIYMPIEWREFFEGVIRVDYAAEDKKGDLSTHWRLKTYRVSGWSPPYLKDAYRELCVEVGEDDKMMGYGVFFHLFFDNLFLGEDLDGYLSGNLPEKWPRIRSGDLDVVVVQGEEIDTGAFKSEVLYPAYAEHYRRYQGGMEELLRQMPDQFKAFSRLRSTMPDWKGKVVDYAKKRSKLYPDGPLAFTPDELDEFAEKAAQAFISTYPGVVAEMRFLTLLR